MESEKSRVRINITVRSGVWRSAAIQAIEAGVSTAAFVWGCVERVMAWPPADRAAIFSALSKRFRNQRVEAFQMAVDQGALNALNDTRRLDWVEEGINPSRSKWVDMAIEAVLAGGLEKAPRAGVIRPFTREVREKMLLAPDRWGVKLDKSGAAPSSFPCYPLLLRLPPSVAILLERNRRDAGMSSTDAISEAIIEAYGLPSPEDEAASVGMVRERMARLGAKASADAA